MLGPVENAIYVNQQTASVASDKTAANSRFDLQALANSNALDGKEKEVEELRPTEENLGINSDKDHEKNEAKQELERSEKDEEKDEEKVTFKSNHILDIKV